MRFTSLFLSYIALLNVIFIGQIEAGHYYQRRANAYIGQSQWPSYYAYYGGPAYAAYPYTSAYAYYYPSSYTNYTYPSYPYFGYYYRNNTIIRSPTQKVRSETGQRNNVYIYQTDKKQDEGKPRGGVFFYSD